MFCFFGFHLITHTCMHALWTDGGASSQHRIERHDAQHITRRAEGRQPRYQMVGTFKRIRFLSLTRAWGPGLVRWTDTWAIAIAILRQLERKQGKNSKADMGKGRGIWERDNRIPTQVARQVRNGCHIGSAIRVHSRWMRGQISQPAMDMGSDTIH